MESFTIASKQYNVSFDFSAILAFEEVTGKTFSSLDILHMSTKDTLGILYASVKCCNEEYPTFEDFTKSITATEYTALNNIVGKLMLSFYEVPAIAESHVPNADNNEEGDDEKKA